MRFPEFKNDGEWEITVSSDYREILLRRTLQGS
jgi:hypothetical protein